MSRFTLGVVNVGGGECRGGECRTILVSLKNRSCMDLYKSCKDELKVVSCKSVDIQLSCDDLQLLYDDLQFSYDHVKVVSPPHQLQQISFDQIGEFQGYFRILT